MCLSHLDREEDRVSAAMEEVLVQHDGEIVHVDVHVAMEMTRVQ